MRSTMSRLLPLVTILLSLSCSQVGAHAASASFLYAKAETKRKYGSGYGFGGDARGGESGETIEVFTKEELARALCNRVKDGYCLDAAPRNVILQDEVDFTTDDGIVTEPGCDNDAVKHPECTVIKRHILNRYDSCRGRPMVQVAYSHAGVAPLLVGSNKTLRGGGTIVGSGLLFRGVSNVFVSGIFIDAINPRVAFAGAAFTVDNSTRVFIDNCTVRETGIFVRTRGRQNAFTVSNSLFYGADEYIPSCGDYHFFLWLVDSYHDRVTFYKNRVVNALGSGFSTSTPSSAIIHLICNTFVNSSMEAMVYAQGDATVLAEGNSFRATHRAGLPFGGAVYMPRVPPDSKRCKPLIDRICLLNEISEAQCGTDGCRTNEEVLQTFKMLDRSFLAAF
ncbi:unnamed protein product [Bemisia tabaci]|uniref:Uncharacterized protein n=1 Tax=Bemisia tabaci TaxID=7038 RepID=A0A9P0A372_BEMTA|nr:unnamed protein product [Bemisia tabaci]